MTIYVAIGGVIVVLLFLVWRAFKGAEDKGRAEAEKRRLHEMIERARRANEIDEKVLRLPDDDLDRELFDGR